ncbi:unnamed protein product [Symbiodinium sp. CCMP2592]|nr:unnamed protein product [Symbiodinium sp. CCMP2592]
MRRKKRDALRAELLAAGDPILSWQQARSRPIPSAGSSAQQAAKSKSTGRQATVKCPMRRKRRRLRAKPTVGLESFAATVGRCKTKKIKVKVAEVEARADSRLPSQPNATSIDVVPADTPRIKKRKRKIARKVGETQMFSLRTIFL